MNVCSKKVLLKKQPPNCCASLSRQQVNKKKKWLTNFKRLQKTILLQSQKKEITKIKCLKLYLILSGRMETQNISPSHSKYQ